ncbi:MAG: 50S ribosomal protein L19e [Candidatus Bathyarchaeota archaeon]|jgi:large subunit ribosomal protein L19e|nr:50S ribosomal protein L19e [Candidatus Bathyarchaeota archaeon]
MDLKSQKRIAAQLLKAGQNRVWMDPEQLDRIENAITKNEIRRLVHEGVIRRKAQLGISKGRGRKLRKGAGSRKGSKITKKRLWIKKIRALRKGSRELVEKRMITRNTYRKLINMSKGGAFRSKSHLKEYIEAHKLLRRK